MLAIGKLRQPRKQVRIPSAVERIDHKKFFPIQRKFCKKFRGYFLDLFNACKLTYREGRRERREAQPELCGQSKVPEDRDGVTAQPSKILGGPVDG